MATKHTIADFTAGTEIHYTGDMANPSGNGTITGLNPANRWSNGTVNIQLTDGRIIKAIEPCMFDATPGQRFYLMTEWQAKRAARIAEMEAEYAAMLKGRA